MTTLLMQVSPRLENQDTKGRAVNNRECTPPSNIFFAKASHHLISVVRAGVDASNVARPVTNISKFARPNALKSRAAQGLFNGGPSP